jgi:hypothetical protein
VVSEFFNLKHKNNLKEKEKVRKKEGKEKSKKKGIKTCLGARYLHHPPENRADLMRHVAGKPL